MSFGNFFANLRFTGKILLLVGLMGVLAAAITGYTIANMRAINQQYRDLLAHEASAALVVGDAARHLGNASQLAYTVLTEQDEARMLQLLNVLNNIEEKYDSKLQRLQALLPARTADVDSLSIESRQVFDIVRRIIQSAARWRGDRALQIIHTEFEPALAVLRRDMDALRDSSIGQFKSASSELNRQTSKTIAVTLLAIVGALLVVLPLSIYIAITQMSRPISQLTRTMKRMSERHYGDAIPMTGRGDEIGKMANALQVFQKSMQREDQLAVEVAESAEMSRLSQQLIDLTSAIPGAVFQMQVSTDGWRRVMHVSEKAAQLHGQPLCKLQQLAGAAGHEFLYSSAADMQLAQDAFLNSVRTLELLNFDTAVVQAGQTRWIKTLATARRTVDGGALFNGVWLDVSEQTLQADALARAKDAAEQAATDKARFLATMSHEIRTPLNAILGMTQLALRHEAEGDQHQRLEKTLRAGQHLLKIVNDVLDISKIEAGKMEIEFETFSTREWVASVQDMVRLEDAEKDLALRWELSPDLPAWLLGSRHRMSQILINYLNNAIKFTSTGSITVRVDCVDEDALGLLLRCAVSDTGIGISAQDQTQLFKSFSQADTSLTRRFGGTGLGLAISHRLAQLMGGETGCDSAPAQGSEFWFTARVHRSVAPADADTLLRGHEASDMLGVLAGRSHRVLLVDDNQLNRAVANGMLKMGGIVADEAHDGAAALAVLQAAADGTYAAVLMDMQMPVMDGISATRALRADKRFDNLVVIAWTANASEDDVARCRAAGMDDHLAKPLLEAPLWRCMRRWLGPGAAAALAPSVQFTARPPTAEIDTNALDDLRAALGEEDVKRVLDKFLHDTQARLDRLRLVAQHPETMDWADLIHETHNLSGTVGSFGLVRMGALSHELHLAAAADNQSATIEKIALFLECSHVDLAMLRVCAGNMHAAAPLH